MWESRNEIDLSLLERSVSKQTIFLFVSLKGCPYTIYSRLLSRIIKAFEAVLKRKKSELEYYFDGERGGGRGGLTVKV